MLKLDLLVPVILILCLIALAYILSKVFSPAEQRGDTGEQTEILLDPDRYREGGDSEDLGAATNINDDNQKANVSNTPSATTGDVDELDDYYQDESLGEVADNDDDKYYDENAASSPATTTTVQRPVAATSGAEDRSTSSSSTTQKRVAVKPGEYHVIAGSYRQEVLARQQVQRLKKAGFPDAYLGYTNRGAYAVAVAGSSAGESEARALSTKVKAKGFDTFVKKGS